LPIADGDTAALIAPTDARSIIATTSVELGGPATPGFDENPGD
jgi:hypothetical protein